MVVQEHQIQVRPRHHLPPAGLAQSDHDHAAAAHPAEPLREIGLDDGQQHPQRHIRHRGAPQPGGVSVQPPLHLGHRNGKILLLDRPAGELDRLLQSAVRRATGGAGPTAHSPPPATATLPAPTRWPPDDRRARARRRARPRCGRAMGGCAESGTTIARRPAARSGSDRNE